MATELPGVGVFGTGKNAELLVKILRSHGFVVVAIWSSTLEAALDAGATLDVPFATNKVDDVLLHRNVGFVTVLCQPDLHAQIAVKALGIGKHVLCDVPVALNQGQVIKMVHAAQYYPSLISVLGHGLRYVAAFQELKKRIASGYIGQLAVCDVSIHYNNCHCGPAVPINHEVIGESDTGCYTANSNQGYDWWCSKLMGGGVMSCVGSHIIDMLAFITDQTANKVHGITRTCTRTTQHVSGIRRIDSDHFCCFQMQLSGGALANISLNSHVPGPYSQQIIVCGSRGRLTIRGGELFGQLVEETSEQKLAGLPSDNGLQAGLSGLVQSLKAAFLTNSGTQDGTTDRPVRGAATFEDGQYVQAVLDAVRVSASTRHWEQVAVHSDAEQ